MVRTEIISSFRYVHNLSATENSVEIRQVRFQKSFSGHFFSFCVNFCDGYKVACIVAKILRHLPMEVFPKFVQQGSFKKIIEFIKSDEKDNRFKHFLCDLRNYQAIFVQKQTFFVIVKKKIKWTSYVFCLSHCSASVSNAGQLLATAYLLCDVVFYSDFHSLDLLDTWIQLSVFYLYHCYLNMSTNCFLFYLQCVT